MAKAWNRMRMVLSVAVVLAFGAAFASTPLLSRAQDGTPAAGGVTPYEAPENVGDLEGSIATDGSSTVGPVTEAAAEEFSAIAEDVEITVDISGTGGGFERFCQGETDIQNASRAIDEEEIAACAENGVEYYAFAVAFDGITVVVNEANDYLTCVSVSTLATIWGPESAVDNFNQLSPDFPDQELTLYGPGTDSGTYDYFVEQVLGEDAAGETLDSRQDYTASEDDNVLVEGVAGDEGGLGYFGYAYFAENQDSLNAVAVARSDDLSDCVSPSPETIRDGTYAPLSRPLYVYVAAESLGRPEVQEFMRFYIASAAALAAEVGFVEAPAEDYVADQQKIEGAIAGEVAPDSQGTPAA